MLALKPIILPLMVIHVLKRIKPVQPIPALFILIPATQVTQAETVLMSVMGQITLITAAGQAQPALNQVTAQLPTLPPNPHAISVVGLQHIKMPVV